MTWGDEELARLLDESKNLRNGPDELAAWLESLGIDSPAFARISRTIGRAALTALAQIAREDGPTEDAYAAVGAAFAGGFELGVMFEQERSS